jgi:hypothetical protein
MEDLTYEQTVELEANVAIKNKADKIYRDFLQNICLSPSKYKDGKFLFTADEHNATYFKITDKGDFQYQCRFLHESYDVTVTPSAIFSAIKNKNRGVEHLASAVSKLSVNGC